ncbi:MAG: Flp family type IVb pilin [Acidobacteria bacterium]|nr:Flp family type IVb pilin [Acidobacteriota bacterium]
MKNLIQRFIREEDGQDLIEYALLIVFIAVIVVVALEPLGITVQGVYESINTKLKG